MDRRGGDSDPPRDGPQSYRVFVLTFFEQVSGGLDDGGLDDSGLDDVVAQSCALTSRIAPPLHRYRLDVCHFTGVNLDGYYAAVN
jgi:hypothetical protein